MPGARLKAIGDHGLRLGLGLCVLLTACSARPAGDQQTGLRAISAADYYGRARGHWLGAVVANFTALPTEGQYLAEPNPAATVDFVLLPAWSTDDDTHVEWVDLHILEEHGLDPTYAQIRDEWVDHVNNDIWWANRVARDLMEAGWLPPETGSTPQNPYADWAVAAQLETEIFGVIAPGLPAVARERARTFARVTNEGTVVDAAAFYAELYARAFFEPDPRRLIETTAAGYPPAGAVGGIARHLLQLHAAQPADWRAARQEVVAHYGDAPNWNASRVNFALTLLALLYGAGDYTQTVTIATLAGWDNDINATTAGGLVGLLAGYDGLPADLRAAAGDLYLNEDMTNLPPYDTISNIALRTQRLAEQVIVAAGGRVEDGTYWVPVQE